MNWKKTLSLTIVFVLFLGSSVLAGSATKKVDFLLDWVPNTNHTGIYVALEKGWYSDAGINLNVIEPAGNMSVEKMVGAGKADFGISFQEWATSAMAQGVPIVSLAAVVQENTSGFASLEKKDIDRPKEFSDKSYGGWGLPIEKAILKALVKGDGGNFETMKFVNIGKGDLITMLAQKKFDLAWIYYGWEGIQAEMRGLDLNVVMLNDYKKIIPNYYTPIVISSRSYVNENPETVSKFMRATARGYNYAIEKPKKAAEILMKYTPESDPELVRKSQKWMSPRYRGEASYWGKQKLSVWSEFASWMKKHGLIKGEFDPKKAFTNRFLPGND